MVKLKKSTLVSPYIVNNGAVDMGERGKNERANWVLEITGKKRNSPRLVWDRNIYVLEFKMNKNLSTVTG